MSGNSTVEGGIIQHHIVHAMTFSPSDRHEREALVDRGGIIEQIGAVEMERWEWQGELNRSPSSRPGLRMIVPAVATLRACRFFLSLADCLRLPSVFADLTVSELETNPALLLEW